MKIIWSVLMMVLLFGSGNAQVISNIDFDEIKKSISDTNSTYFYPKLRDRLNRLDTTLTPNAFKHLYYGAVFQDSYHPYGATDKENAFREAFTSNPSIEEIEKLGKAVLDENPVNLGVLLKMIILYNKAERVKEATVYAKLYVGFLEVIYASGRGDTCENGFVVISVDDEYLIANDLGLKVIKQFLIGSCDLLQFSKKGQKRRSRIKQLYFNVRMPLTYLSKSFDHSDLPEAEPQPDEE